MLYLSEWCTFLRFIVRAPFGFFFFYKQQLQIDFHPMLRLLFPLLFAFFIFLPNHSQNITPIAWMKQLPDSTPLCHLSIPATHDSGALEGGEAFQTQDLTLEEQLELGVRGFDIRLKACDNNLLGVYHSIVFQDMYWETEVLLTFINFLKEHPSETLIVFVKKEGGSNTAFADLLTQSIASPQNAPYFVSKVPNDITLGTCRGKIILIHRDNLLTDFPGVQCHGWQNNTSSLITLKDRHGIEVEASVEDHYQFPTAESAKEKSALAWSHMKQSMNADKHSHKWFFTFASATALPEDEPQAFATIVNAELAQLTQPRPATYGMVFMDFLGTTDGRTLIQNLIQANF